MTIYDVAENLRKAFLRAFVPEKMMAEFRVSRICPKDRNIFTDAEFISAFVTSAFVTERLELVNEQVSKVCIIYSSEHVAWWGSI